MTEVSLEQQQANLEAELAQFVETFRAKAESQADAIAADKADAEAREVSVRQWIERISAARAGGEVAIVTFGKGQNSAAAYRTLISNTARAAAMNSLGFKPSDILNKTENEQLKRILPGWVATVDSEFAKSKGLRFRRVVSASAKLSRRDFALSCLRTHGLLMAD